MEDKVPHVFHVTLGMDLKGDLWATVRSLDGQIHTRFPAESDIVGMFPSGVNELTCHGHLDLNTNLIMLGKIIDA